jgi:hypothetical protein
MLARPFSCLCVPKFVDVKVRRTDAGCQLSYLPQATEEDHGARPFRIGSRPLRSRFEGWPNCEGLGERE